MGARYYDSQVGRFVSRDTLLDQHPYLYCQHDPVDCLDPSGHWIIGFFSGLTAGLLVGLVISLVAVEVSLLLLLLTGALVGYAAGLVFGTIASYFDPTVNPIEEARCGAVGGLAGIYGGFVIGGGESDGGGHLARPPMPVPVPQPA